jgi:thiol-disulfide isomerase/thioredoxin
MHMDRRHLLAAACAAPLWARAQTAPLADAAAAEAKAPPLPAVGTPLALPAIERLDGTRFEPRDADGRVLVLYWWASWCPFCAETTPHVEALWRAQRSKGLALLALSIDSDAKPARDYLARRGYALPAAWVTPAVARALPKPRGLPVTLVRGRDGRVLQAEAGQLFPEDVQALARHF